MHWAKIFLGLSPILILFAASPALAAAEEPVRVLAMGTVLPSDTPVFYWCEDDPLAVITVIPTRLGGASVEPEDAKRLIRLYFPRKFGPETVDILLYSAGDVVHFTTSQISTMIKGVEGGVGAIADCGGTSAIKQFIDTWVASGIDRIFPNDVSAVTSAKYSFVTPGYPGYFLKAVPYKIRVRDVPTNPFSPFVAVGIENVHGFAGRNMIARPGSSVLASMAGDHGFLEEGNPFSLYWEYEEGRTLTVSEWFGHPFWGDYGSDIHISDNPYGQELFINLLLYITDRPIFEDIAEIHQLKRDIAEYRIRRDNLISAIDFATKFGANLLPVEKELARIEGERKDADGFYLEGDYSQCSSILRSTVNDLQAVFNQAIDLKNRALTFVFLCEWLAVTGVLVISGSVLYEVMIRRRAYREVMTTAASMKAD